jgi:3-oxoacyl-[acyl-carrier-protein] synthase-3
MPRVSADRLAEGAQFPYMNGKNVFKHAVTRMPEVLREALEVAGTKLEDVDLFLFHQANLRINEYVAQALEIPAHKLRNNIQRYGNCSAASIPMLLDEALREGAIRKGGLVSMTGFGSGFSWASAIVRW